MKCFISTCSSKGYYGVPGEHKHAYCRIHKEFGMKHLIAPCHGSSCCKTANFNFKGKKAKYCKTCSSTGMVNIATVCPKKDCLKAKTTGSGYCRTHLREYLISRKISKESNEPKQKKQRTKISCFGPYPEPINKTKVNESYKSRVIDISDSSEKSESSDTSDDSDFSDDSNTLESAKRVVSEIPVKVPVISNTEITKEVIMKSLTQSYKEKNLLKLYKMFRLLKSLGDIEEKCINYIDALENNNTTKRKR